MQSPEEALDDYAQADILRAARLCAPCLDRVGRITFSCARNAEADLAKWGQAIFIPVIVPAIHAVHAAAMQQGVREIIAVDQSLDSGLPTMFATRSRSAGQIAAADFHAPASERTLARYLDAVANKGTAGHFVTIFTTRAAVFHISAHTALMAYLFLEMRSLPTQEVWPAVAYCLAQLPARASFLRAA